MANSLSWAPPEVAAAPEWAPPEASAVAANAAQTPDWKTLFSGPAEATSQMTLEQRTAFASLDADTNNTKETRAEPVILSYLKHQLPDMPEDVIQQNLPAVKQAFAKARLGIDQANLTNTDFYNAVGEHEKAKQLHLTQEYAAASPVKKMQMLGRLAAAHAGEPLDGVKWSLKNAWEKANTPFVRLPELGPLPDVPNMGSANPALVGFVYNFFKPIAEGVESPLGLATLGALPALKAGGTAARAAFVGISGIFAGLMAKASVEGIIEKQPKLEGKSTMMQAQILAPEIGAGFMAIMTPFVTAMEMRSPMKRARTIDALKGKTVEESATVIRNEAALSADPAIKEKLIKSADGLDSISEKAIDALQKEKEAAAAAPKEAPAEFVAAATDEGFPETWNLTEDIPPSDAFPDGAKAGSTVSRQQLEKAGFKVPEPPLQEPASGAGSAPNTGSGVEAPAPASKTANIDAMDNGGFVVTDEAGKLIDYAATLPEAEALAKAHESPAPVAPEPVKPESVAAAKEASISLSNADIDAELASMGLPPAKHGEKLAFEEARMDAAQTLAADPMAGKRLVEALKADPRPITGREDALLLHEMNRLKIERDTADKAYIAAVKGGDDVAIAEAKINADNAARAFADAADVDAIVGTENAIGLALRQMRMKEDFSLAALERRKIVANGGEPLTPEQTAEVRATSEKYAAKEKELSDARAAAEERAAVAEADATMLRLIAENKAKTAKAKSPSAVLKFISEQADSARERIKARRAEGRAQSGIDPVDLADHVIIGADYIAKGAVDFAKWSKKMTKELGEKLEESYLKTVFEKSKAAQEDLATAAVSRDIKAERASTVEAMKAAPPENLGNYARKLAEQFVAEGVHDRNALIDAVHKELKAVKPEITRRQAMDAISGYGDFKALNPDAVKAELRDLKGQMQQLAKLEDMQAKKAPAKTGVERRVPSGEERRLQKLVNEAKRKGGFNVTDPAKQLKTAIEAIKTRLKNQIEDLDFQISTKQKTVRGKTETPYDAEATDLRERRDALKAQFDQMFPKGEMTDAQRLSLAEKAADRQIAELERQIKSGEIFPPGGKEPLKLTSAELEAKKARIEALKEERQYLRGTVQAKDILSPEESALQAYKTRTRNRIAELQEKLANEDFASKPKPEPPPMDDAANLLQSELEQVKLDFEHALANDRYEKSSPLQKAKTQTLGAYDVSRTYMTTGEFSVVLRQGLMSVASHPILAAKTMGTMFRAFVADPVKARAINLETLNRPEAKLAKRAKLHLIEEGQSLNKQEEILMAARLAEKVPVAGKALAHFNQASVAFLNKIRLDVWNEMRKGSSDTPEFQKQVAMFVNESTGRGSLGSLEAAAVPLGRVMFAPRFFISRLQVLAGHSMWGGTMETRTAIAKEYARTLVGLGLFYAMLDLALDGEGKKKATVSLDPRSSDFGKVKIGTTRLDPLAGLSQAAVFAARTWTGESVDSRGKVHQLRGDIPFGGDKWSDVAARFARSKAHPVLGATINLLDEQDLGGNKADVQNQALNLMGPLTYADIYNAFLQQDVDKASAISLLAILGVGVQTYDDKHKKK